MLLSELRSMTKAIIAHQGELTANDWVWILGELADLDERKSDALYGAVEIFGEGFVFTWWSC